MLFANSTMTREFPTLLGAADNGTAAGLERWLYLTQALQVIQQIACIRTHCSLIVRVFSLILPILR